MAAKKTRKKDSKKKGRAPAKKASAKAKAPVKSLKKSASRKAIVKAVTKKPAPKKTATKKPATKKAAPKKPANVKTAAARKPAGAQKRPTARPTSAEKFPALNALPLKVPKVERSNGLEPITLHHRRPSAKELKALRVLLVERRRRLMSDVDTMEQEALDDTREISLNHLADSSTDQYDQDFTLHMIENETTELRMIQLAIDKIDGKHKDPYGRCESCGIWISVERLKAKPYARICIHCISRFEREGGGELFGILPEQKY